MAPPHTNIRATNIREARLNAEANHPWKIMLTFRGTNSSNVSGQSDKWWMAWGIGKGQGYSNHGKTGTSGLANPNVFPVDKLIETAKTKVKDGYVATIDPQPTVKKRNPILDMPEPFCKIRTLVYRSKGCEYFALDYDHKVVAKINLETCNILLKEGGFKAESRVISLTDFGPVQGCWVWPGDET